MEHSVPIKNCAFVLMVLLLGTVLVSCGRDPVTLDATDPLDRIVIRPTGETLAYAETGVKLPEIVSLQPFLERGLRPGMTVTEAASLLGDPDFLTREREGRDQVFGFESSVGVFEIVKQRVSSEGTEADRWFLRYHPGDCTALVDPLVLEQLRELQPFPVKVTLFAGPNRRGKALLEFDDERACSRIWWLRADDVGLP